jgi:hypothetical protein
MSVVNTIVTDRVWGGEYLSCRCARLKHLLHQSTYLYTHGNNQVISL